MSKHTKIQNKNKNEFISLKNWIIGYGNISKGLGALKALKSTEYIYKHFPKISREPIFEKYISGYAYPKRINELGYNSLIQPSYTIGQELFWLACILRTHKDSINEFMIMEREYSRYILFGDYENANLLLDKIQEHFGISLWLIENRIAIIQNKESLEKQKEYTMDIVTNEDVNNLVRYLTNYFSLRAEKNVSSGRYDMMLKQVIQKNKKVDNGFDQYTIYKLNFFGSTVIENLRPVIFYENSFSIIDRYLSYIKICQFAFSFDRFAQEIPLIKNSIEVLIDKINDHKLVNLALYSSCDFDLSKNQKAESVMSIFDYYTTGEYEKCITECEILLSENPDLVEIYELLVKAHIYLNKALEFDSKYSMKNRIIQLMHDVICKNSTANESYQELYKIAFVYPNLSWSSTITSFLNRYYIGDKKNITRPNIIFGALNNYAYNPVLGKLMVNERCRHDYYAKLCTIFDKNETMLLYEAICNNDLSYLDRCNLPVERKLKSRAAILYRTNRITEAIVAYKSLYNLSQETLGKQDGIVGLLKCYLSEYRYMECIELAVDTYIENEYMIYRLPVAELVEIIDRHEDGADGKISVPILCDLYSKYIHEDKDDIRNIAYEDFLYFNGFSKPSEIGPKHHQFDINKLVYYLKYICVQQVMDGSISFRSSEEVEKERILVCQILIEIDSINKDEYVEEIRTISQKLTIDKGRREIEESKIFVNVEGVKKTVEKNLRESYNRYISLNSDLKISDDPDYISLGLNESDGLELLIPGNEKLGQLQHMLLEIRDNFVSSNHYGLDVYLSVGIRHGTITGQLRCLFEPGHLITQKDYETAIYHKNEFWAEYFSEADESTVENVMNLLGTFSRQVDEVLDSLKNIWIQIKTEDKNPGGLFDYQLYPEELQYIQSKMSHDMRYEEFVDLIIEWLWQKTEDNLTIVRSHINHKVGTCFTNAFSELQMGLDGLKNEIDVVEINAAIAKAMTSFYNELAKISSWFKRAQQLESADYEVKLPVEIALEMIKNIYPNNSISPEISTVEMLKLRGKTLKGVVDIFFILFDNVVKHSCVDSNCEVVLDMRTDNTTLTISVENEVSSTVDRSDMNARLDKIKEQIKKGMVTDRVKKEGGTGFYKIDKILSTDLNCKYELNFGLNDHHIFKVDISLGIGGLVA